MRHQFVRIHDNEPLWLEMGTGLSVPSVDAADFECMEDERHRATIIRRGDDWATYIQGSDWTEWWDEETGDATDCLHAEDFHLGDKLQIEVT